MKELAINQSRLAEKMEVSQGTVSGWARGNNMPHRKTLEKLAEVLGVTIQWLHSGIEPKLRGHPTPGTVLDDNPSGIPFERYLTTKGFGERIQWLRERSTLSMAEFGKRVGYAPSYISRLESGSRENPSKAFVDSVVREFLISRTWLLTGEGTPGGVDAPLNPGTGETTRTQAILSRMWERDQIAHLIDLIAEHLRTPDISDLLVALSGVEQMTPSLRRDLVQRLNSILARRMNNEDPHSEFYKSNGMTFDKVAEFIEKQWGLKIDFRKPPNNPEPVASHVKVTKAGQEHPQKTKAHK